MSEPTNSWYEPILQSGLLPDAVLRFVVRRSINGSLNDWRSLPPEVQSQRKEKAVEALKRSPIAIETDTANDQHYEVPSEFFQLVLGHWLKYSCCYWPQGVDSLAAAEAAMLELTCRRAGLRDGMRLLDLGCGWGSLSSWMAEHYPNSQITALSNSASQQQLIQARADRAGHDNLTVLKANVAEVEFNQQFDRVLSIEMFEHMRNYQQLLAKIKGWLAPDGKLFVHHFSHQQQLYEFDVTDPQDYMARTYFAGGTMPSHDMLYHFSEDLVVERDWRVNGQHYAKTLRAWLDALDANQGQAMQIFEEIDGPRSPAQWLTYWRNFFIICEETFAIGGGEEYLVSHLLLSTNDQ